MPKIVTKEALKAFRKKTDDRYVIEGEYSPETSVGEADKLTPYSENSGFIDKTAFTFQTAGGDSDVGYKAYLNKLIGNSESDREGGFNHSQSSKYTMVGYNQNDEVYEEGDIEYGGADIPDSNMLRNKNFIRVFEDTLYGIVNQSEVESLYVYCYDENKRLIDSDVIIENTFSIPTGVSYVRFSFQKQDNPQLCFFLYWDGSKVTYEPHYKKEYDLPNIELKKCGNAADTLYPDGTLIRKVGEVDIGTLTFDVVVDSNNGVVELSGLEGVIKTPADDDTKANITIGSFEVLSFNDFQNTSGDKICVDLNGTISIKSLDWIEKTEQEIRELLSGTHLLYELAEPVVTQNDEYKFEQLTEIDDFGTQEFDSEVAQGAEFFYACDYKAFIDTLGGRDDIQYDANQIASVKKIPTADKIQNKLENDPKKAFIVLGSVPRNADADSITVFQPTVVAITSHGFRNTPYCGENDRTFYHGAFKGTKRGNRPILLLGSELDWVNKYDDGRWKQFIFYGYEDILNALPDIPSYLKRQKGNDFIYEVDINIDDLTSILQDTELTGRDKEIEIEGRLGPLGVHPHKLLIYNNSYTFYAFRKFMVKFFHPDKFDESWLDLPGVATPSDGKRYFADVYLDILVKLEIPVPDGNGMSTATITYTVQRKFFDK